MLERKLREAERFAEEVKRDKEVMEETLATMALLHLQEKEELEEKIEALKADMDKLLKNRWPFGKKQRPRARGFGGNASGTSGQGPKRSPRTYSFAH